MIPASSAASRGLRSCGSCGMLSSAAQERAECARCGAPLHDRRPDSLARTWALLTAAVILYVPANLLPVMYTDWLFGSQRDTIMSGVTYLWRSGSWPLALVVFVASVTVPLLKIVALAYLALSVQLRSSWQPHQRAQLYRIVEIVGRWSMLDMYVITILVALVQAKAVATIHAGPGAVAFAAVVVLTMLAAMSFDPRLVWDRAEGARRG